MSGELAHSPLRKRRDGGRVERRSESDGSPEREPGDAGQQEQHANREVATPHTTSPTIRRATIRRAGSVIGPAYRRVMFLPTRCPLCATIGPAPCGSCALQLERAPAVPAIAGCTSIGACYRYDDAARSMMLAFKYRNRRDIVAFCARALAAMAPPVDLVTWAPSTAVRVRDRGFDQAEVLARAVARVLRVPTASTLRRVGAGHQTGLDAAARRVGPVFEARAPRVAGRGVLLIDDIVTTGSTFAQAASALGAGGALAVHARACCWTPPGRGRHEPGRERTVRLGCGGVGGVES